MRLGPVTWISHLSSRAPPHKGKVSGLKRAAEAELAAAAKRLESQPTSNSLVDGDGPVGPSTWVNRVIASFESAAGLSPSELLQVTPCDVVLRCWNPHSGNQADHALLLCKSIAEKPQRPVLNCHLLLLSAGCRLSQVLFVEATEKKELPPHPCHTSHFTLSGSLLSVTFYGNGPLPCTGGGSCC